MIVHFIMAARYISIVFELWKGKEKRDGNLKYGLSVIITHYLVIRVLAESLSLLSYQGIRLVLSTQNTKPLIAM